MNSTQNGKELIFTSPNTDRRVWSVSVSTEPTFKVGEPRELFKARLDVLSLVPTPRGDRLLQSVPAGDVPPPGIAVTLNWQAMVSRR